MPMITKAIIARQAGQPWTYEDVEIAEPGKGQLHVQIVSVGLCHTDVKTGAGEFRMKPPCVLGHEGTGYVTKVGPGVSNFDIGDPVILSFASCGDCHYCNNGMSPYCSNLARLNFSGTGPDGNVALAIQPRLELNALFFGQSSMSQTALVDASCAVKVHIRAKEELKKLVLGCGFQTGAGSILNVCKPPIQATIAVWGCGGKAVGLVTVKLPFAKAVKAGVGLAAIMAAKLSTPKVLIAIDVFPAKLALAKKYGATHTINGKTEDVAARIKEITGGNGVQFALDAVGSVAILALAQKCTAARGTFVTIGGTGAANVTLSPIIQLGMGLTYRGCHQGDAVPGQFLPFLIDLWQQGGPHLYSLLMTAKPNPQTDLFPFDELLTFYPAADFQKALHDMESGAVVKPVLVF